MSKSFTVLLAQGFVLTMWVAALSAHPSMAAQRGAAPPKIHFNRSSIGGGSGVSPGMRQRAYRIDDAVRAHGGTHPNLKTRVYRNTGEQGSVVLPKVSAQQEPVTYRSVNMVPGGHARRYANGRVIIGSDGSAYVTRHYGQDGGKTKRIH